jgi:DNA-binding GntR family transcriptional regulator
VAELERRVLNGEFQPGERLREVELASEYAVGRHTLRAAFDALVRRGLLEKVRNRGVSVPALTARDLVEISELRTALEAQAFRALAARAFVPPAARQAVERLDELADDAPWRLVVEADFDFHSAVVAAAGNRRLKRMHDDLKSEILLGLVQLGHGYASVSTLAEEHRQLVAAIERGDPAEAERGIRSHLERAAAWLGELASSVGR